MRLRLQQDSIAYCRISTVAHAGASQQSIRCCKALAAQVAYSNTWCGAKSWVLAAQPMLQQQYLRSCQLLHIHSLTSPPRGGAAAQATPKRACRVAAEAAGAASSAAARIGGSSSTALVDWVIKKGGSVNGVTMADLSGSDGGSGWGLVATQAITQPGARLIELPNSCQLMYDGSADPRVLGLIQQVPDDLWGAKLAVQVLVHRLAGANSPFATYISYLPIGVSGVPMFFCKEALEAMEYPPVVEQVKRRGRWLHRFSLDVLSKLPGTAADPFEGVLVDINAIGWAFAVVTSRAFRVAGPTAPAALLPLIDIANHSFSPNCEVVPMQGGVAMIAKRQIAAGEPLLLSYGKLSNDFLLMDYGFVVPNNPHDRVALRFDMDLVNAAALIGGARDASGQLLQLNASAPWRQAHLARLKLSGAAKCNLQVLLGGPNLVEPRLLAAVRGLVATYQSEVEDLTLEVLGSWDRPLNKQNEVASIRILIGMAMVALQNFSTGLEHDLALVSGTAQTAAASSSDSSSSTGSHQRQQQSSNAERAVASLPPEMQLAVSFRSQRKQLLVDLITALADQLKQVSRMPGLKDRPVVVAQKGQKPTPATSKGFGASR
eukprot:GHRR01002073.1.p1 GENE.GHRR01002073.1~~GHRR01002073.1.p1  ORF type:complete len:603 (+),score=223.44 GHRR01002073.1:581-2389(+)